MNLVQSILMGIVQGLSEFLPISSSAHLVFTSNLYKAFKNIPITEQSTEEIFLDIMLHLGTLLAVLIFFRKDLYNICTSTITSIRSKNWENNNAKLGIFIILGTIITGIIAGLLENTANILVFHPAIVGGLLIITGGTLFLSEYLSQKTELRTECVNIKQAILVGLSQGIAVLPGISRSGWTIAAGLFAGMKRETAARYSFLLSIPIILIASMLYPLIKIDFEEALTYNWAAIITGTFVSGIVGYFCIKYFMKFISKFSLNIFGWYCIIMGFFTLLFFNIYK